jgi:hypothetical protein
MSLRLVAIEEPRYTLLEFILLSLWELQCGFSPNALSPTDFTTSHCILRQELIVCLHDYSIHAINMLLLVLLVSLHCRRRLEHRKPCHSTFELRRRASFSAECTAPTSASKQWSITRFPYSRRRRHHPPRTCHPPSCRQWRHRFREGATCSTCEGSSPPSSCQLARVTNPWELVRNCFKYMVCNRARDVPLSRGQGNMSTRTRTCKDRPRRRKPKNAG